MTYRYSVRSRANLNTCHEWLQIIFNEVIRHFDCSIICGYRGEAEQNEAYHKGFSQLAYPLSKHNKVPSLAVDAMPWPIDWKDTKRIIYFAGFVKGVAAKLGYPIIWGGDWNDNNVLSDETFFDLAHYQIKEV